MIRIEIFKSVAQSIKLPYANEVKQVGNYFNRFDIKCVTKIIVLIILDVEKILPNHSHQPIQTQIRKNEENKEHFSNVKLVCGRTNIHN